MHPRVPSKPAQSSSRISQRKRHECSIRASRCPYHLRSVRTRSRTDQIRKTATVRITESPHIYLLIHYATGLDFSVFCAIDLLVVLVRKNFTDSGFLSPSSRERRN